jgi:nucleotide-binding universal stress UspA family protein
MFKSILVPTDGSALSRKAARQAIHLAKEQGANVVGFYVAPPYQPKVYADFVPSDFITPKQYAQRVKKAAAARLNFIKKTAAAAGVGCTLEHAASDFPYLEIVKTAKQSRCDLICMASHGRRGFSRLLLGSETTKVLSHTTVPVLVLR